MRHYPSWMTGTSLGKQLDVYMTREGPWNPEHGDLEIPEDWASFSLVMRSSRVA
jgi:hypothetical protein